MQQRRLSLFLIVLAILVLGVRFSVLKAVPEKELGKQELGLVEYAPLTPLSNSSLALLQTQVDRVSDAAIQGQWSGAEMWMQELDKTWKEIELVKTEKMKIDGEMTNSIMTLQRCVSKREASKVLISARQLTNLIAQLANSS